MTIFDKVLLMNCDACKVVSLVGSCCTSLVLWLGVVRLVQGKGLLRKQKIKRASDRRMEAVYIEQSATELLQHDEQHAALLQQCDGQRERLLLR
ncbi:hypothetical protein HAX54_004506 [Datura stramonium]|uniref:Transmembrane protein n=1 Tax=Datura stramonium TaxID=4076 RepID=A0ABS8T9F7_DATST|nr:hypothetical protein [Datura stramonium]